MIPNPLDDAVDDTATAATPAPDALAPAEVPLPDVATLMQMFSASAIAVSTPDPGPDADAEDPGLSDLWIGSGASDPVTRGHGASQPAVLAAPSDAPSADQILRDRPDVLNAYYSEYWGANNDRHSHAWTNRVGGDTPQDYARYWYDKMGGKDSYHPGASVGAPAVADEASNTVAASGRTTIDGVSADQILADRPDVFQAFFTEYYGPNNDRHSSAWDDRVGGHTPQDYANFWYNTGGKLGGYVPSTTHAVTAVSAEAPTPSVDPGSDLAPLESGPTGDGAVPIPDIHLWSLTIGVGEGLRVIDAMTGI